MLKHPTPPPLLNIPIMVHAKILGTVRIWRGKGGVAGVVRLKGRGLVFPHVKAIKGLPGSLVGFYADSVGKLQKQKSCHGSQSHFARYQYGTLRP